MWWSLIISIFPIVISLTSLGISIYAARKNVREERFNLDFELVKWFGSSTRDDIPNFLWLTIINNSKLPCSILEINVEVKDIAGNVALGIGRGNKSLVSTIITRSNGNEDKKEKYSLDYPQNIDSYSSVGGYFHFHSSNPYYDFEEREAKVTIKTNRGNITKALFLDKGKNIFRVLQNFDSGNRQPRYREDGSEIVYINDGI